ncbi:hypothetical protein [Nitrospirillum sp. BR 11828]|uniref:hypothetical protein n=1 Tax=Nitrospirillum sp. BR 11828 TaxID=3104325 RepID=UPI002ACAB36A|nr:hypothetical protein [Nitrospirillum sp. BR 11828]MDZ5645934.1 hypothetical protein [Nitrospirillum sp. BR 11828]
MAYHRASTHQAIIGASLIAMLLAGPAIAEERGACSADPDLGQSRHVPGPTIDADRFNRVLKSWAMAQGWMKANNYREAGRELLRGLGAMGKCPMHKAPEPPAEFLEQLADDAEDQWSYQQAAILRFKALMSNFDNCMDNFLDHGDQ